MTQTKFRPILFSTPMVQSILEGRKTQTRRVVKHQPSEKGGLAFNDGEHPQMKCPYGEIGDVIWVRETMIYNKNSETFWPVADGYSKSVCEKTGKTFEYEKTIPAIYMPEQACRLFLKITDIRVERLQEITEEDAIAEGVDKYGIQDNFAYKDYVNSKSSYGQAKNSFMSLWYLINGVESWMTNPWVWVISFERIEKPADF